MSPRKLTLGLTALKTTTRTTMTSTSLGEHVVKTGSFLYAPGVKCEIRIVHSPVRYGTGDQDDPPEIANDVEANSYYVQFGSPAQPGVFVAGSVAFPSLKEAMLGAAEQLGAQRALRWHWAPSLCPTMRPNNSFKPKPLRGSA
jgi:hypothetical protein